MLGYPLLSGTQAMTGSMSYVASISFVPPSVRSMPQIMSTPQHQPQVTITPIVPQPWFSYLQPPSSSYILPNVEQLPSDTPQNPPSYSMP